MARSLDCLTENSVAVDGLAESATPPATVMFLP